MRFVEFKTAISESINVPSGRVGTEIADIQKVLLLLGYKLPQHGVDGIRGPETSAAVKQFQTDHGLQVDGDPGPETVGKLNRIIVDKKIKFDKSTPADVKRSSGQAREIDTSVIQDPDFNAKLEKVANALGIERDTLFRIIKFETAGTFSPTSHDPKNVSIGLIGFTEPTARALGTSKAELAKMTAVQQLDYVYKFYKMNNLRPGSDLGTMYMITFMPAFAYSPDNIVLGKEGGGTLMLPNGRSSGLSMHLVWDQNPAFGKSRGKNSFTVGDVKNTINRRR
jgi:peptidoglycan hydrolase-like protein with peptidoglycan-binding domain